MNIKSLDEAMEILQRDTPLSKHVASIGKDINIDTVLENSAEYITDTELAYYLSTVINEIGYTKSEAIKLAGLSEVVGFQIFSGITRPTFNVLMRICIGAGFTLTETQRAIELAGYTPLNPNDERDVVLIHALMHLKKINDVNQTLYDLGHIIL